MAEKVQYFAKKPSRKSLEHLYKAFKKKNGDLKLKVGICGEEYYKTRYSGSGRYKELKEWNILCTATLETAKIIEQQMKEIIFEKTSARIHTTILIHQNHMELIRMKPQKRSYILWN